MLVTSNVDPVHERAGPIRSITCTATLGEPFVPVAGASRRSIRSLPEEVGDTLPACAECGGVLRPNIVWFGETPWPSAIDAIRRKLPQAQVFLEVGTSGAVSYGLDGMAAQAGIPVVRINPDPRPGPGVTQLEGLAENILPALLESLP